MKKAKQPTMTIEERFNNTAENFQKLMARIAEVAKLTTMEVYALWREYSETCRNYDQSPVLFEFIQWNEARLGGNRDALQSVTY